MNKTEQIERRYRTCEVRASGKGGTAEGHPLTWNNVYAVGEFDERIMRGALDAVIDDPGIAALWNHDAGNVLGRQGAGTLRVSQDSVGVAVEFDMPRSAHREREALERGDVVAMSWGFAVGKGNDSWEMVDGRELRTIHKVERVYDFSPTVFPANPSTDIAMRSRDAWRGIHKTQVGAIKRRQFIAALKAAKAKMGANAPSAAQLGRPFGASAETIEDIFAGRRPHPSYQQIEGLAKGLHVDVMILFDAQAADDEDYDHYDDRSGGLTPAAAARRLRLADADMGGAPNDVRRRRTTAQIDLRTSEQVRFDAERNSLHEAAHAVVFHLNGTGVEFVELTAGGGTCRALKGRPISGTDSMAGIGVEEIFNPRYAKREREATASDRRSAVACAERELGPAPKSTGSGWIPQEDRRVEQRLDLYTKTAKSILRNNMKAVEAIAKELRKRGRLSGAQVERIIQEKHHQAA